MGSLISASQIRFPHSCTIRPSHGASTEKSGREQTTYALCRQTGCLIPPSTHTPTKRKELNSRDSKLTGENLVPPNIYTKNRDRCTNSSSFLDIGKS